jgi:hypothetical protein
MTEGKKKEKGKYLGCHFNFSLGSLQWVTRALTSGVKLPGRKVDNSPPSSAEVENE